jgi:hypothetical protein
LRLLAVQCREELRDLHPGVVAVGGAGDLEQARPVHAPRDEDQRVGAAGDHLGQERDGGVARECLQDADLVQDAPGGGLRPCELHEEVRAEGGVQRLELRVVPAGQVRDVNRQPAQFRCQGPQCPRDGGRGGLGEPVHAPIIAGVSGRSLRGPPEGGGFRVGTGRAGRLRPCR